MHCPFCGEADTKVIDSRLVAEGDQVRRRRECLSCRERFTTFESAELVMPRVVKQDGTRQPFDEEKLRTETEKLRVGKSTSFLVAQAQRDLLVSRIAEVRALANYLKALIDLYRQDGSLLERRGIAAPGREPVKLSKK